MDEVIELIKIQEKSNLQNTEQKSAQNPLPEIEIQDTTKDNQ